MINAKDYEAMKNKALVQFKKGQSLFGKDGAFAPLLKDFLEAALEGEMAAHLNEAEKAQGNKRNGKGSKTIKSSEGSFRIQTPEDRNSTFQPQIIQKRQTLLADNLQDKIVGLYGLGMSYRDIATHLEEMYDLQLSRDALNEITDRIIPQVRAWQSRRLESVYPIVWLDAMHFKVQDQGIVKAKALYNVLAVTPAGQKEIIGSYLAETEGAKFWLQVLSDLQNRGVQDILIACTDNLQGFSEAILSIFPRTEVQSCMIHQIRNSMRCLLTRDRKTFMEDLRRIYQAANKIEAEEALQALDTKWGRIYPLVLKSWQNNWDKLSCYFDYPAEIRRMMYTTNSIEAYHRAIRKATKTKGAFSSDMALLKLVFLVTSRLTEQWQNPLPIWSLASQQLRIKFGTRMPFSLTLNS